MSVTTYRRGVARVWSAEERHAIAARYEGGASSHAIAATYGCDEKTILKVVRRAGVPVREAGGPRKTKERIAAQRLYEQGVGVRRIAAQVGVPPMRVFRWKKDFGWSRPLGVSVQRDLIVPSDAAPSRRRVAPPSVAVWRCACGARVTRATTCPQGHAAPWAEAA